MIGMQVVGVEVLDVVVVVQAPLADIRVSVDNKSSQAWKPENFSLGWQFFDPETSFFILEGTWTPVAREVAPGESTAFEISIPFPPEEGAYEIYVSPIEQPDG